MIKLKLSQIGVRHKRFHNFVCIIAVFALSLPATIAYFESVLTPMGLLTSYASSTLIMLVAKVGYCYKVRCLKRNIERSEILQGKLKSFKVFSSGFIKADLISRIQIVVDSRIVELEARQFYPRGLDEDELKEGSIIDLFIWKDCDQISGEILRYSIFQTIE